ncbi:MAG: hypothetical protein ACI8VL_001977 [Bacteroidia bacterium]|jgi:hypothetical protein
MIGRKWATTAISNILLSTHPLNLASSFTKNALGKRKGRIALFGYEALGRVEIVCPRLAKCTYSYSQILELAKLK